MMPKGARVLAPAEQTAYPAAPGQPEGEGGTSKSISSVAILGLCPRKCSATPEMTPTTCFTFMIRCGWSCGSGATSSPRSCRPCGTGAETSASRYSGATRSRLVSGWVLVLCFVFDVEEKSLALLRARGAILIPVDTECPLITLQKFIKPIFTDESYLELYRKQKKHLNTQQLTAFQLLFAWRDKTARREDESYG